MDEESATHEEALESEAQGLDELAAEYDATQALQRLYSTSRADA